MTWWIVTHVPFEGPALIATMMDVTGVEYRTCAPYSGEPLPSAADCAGLVVMGGPMNALDDARHPHLAAERELIADCLARDVPVLGVCLGAQLMAAALGARVYAGEAGEYGAGTVTLTADADNDPVFGGAGATVPVVHWHGDTFDLPDGAVLLAGTDRYPHQAFRVGRAGYGLQFHVELTEAQFPMMADHMPSGTAPGPAHLAAVQARGTVLIGRFLDLGR